MNEAVLTITPNPALDLSGEVDEVVPNEKNYVHSEARHPGGNAINVARVLTRLGVLNLATGFLGGSTGLEITDLLATQKIRTDFIPIRGNTRINVTVQNHKTHNQTRLSFPGPFILPSEKQKLSKMLAKDRSAIWVIGGSLPAGIVSKDLSKWIRIANRRAIPFVLDVPASVLTSLRGEHLSFIKPNLTEWKLALGFKGHHPDLKTLVRLSRQNFPNTAWVCVSSFQGGAVLVGRDEVYFGKLPRIQIHSTAGAGDSMVAGWVGGQIMGLKPADSFRRALACAGATLSTRGTELAHLADVLRLEKKCIVTSVTLPMPAQIKKK